MSLTKTEMGDKSNCKIEFSVAKDTFEKAIDKVYHKQIGKMNIPGFRRGKASRAIVEKLYGKGVFYDDAINEVLPEAYEEAVKESGLRVIGQPKFDVVSLEDGVVLSAEVDIYPEITLENYKGIAVEKPVITASDDEVDREIDVVKQRNGREIEITDKAAELGNTVNIDYEGSVDGVPFDGGKDTGHNLKLGSGSFIPGFEDQIVGHNTGDEFDVNVTFPTEYHAEELAGKAAVFKTKINKIVNIEYPALDDDFAKDVSEFDTFDEYKADVKAKIQKRHDDEADRVVAQKLDDALIELVTCAIPQSMIDAEVETIVRNYDYNFRSQGFNLDTYLKYTNMTLEKFRETLTPDAEKRAKIQLALAKIAELENIQLADEDYDKEYASIAAEYNMGVEDVKKALPQENLTESLMSRKASELVRAAAVITDKAE